MGTAERRAEIIRILRSGKSVTMPQLADGLGASVRTIKRDIDALSVEEHYPILTVQGNGGGVRLLDYKHPHINILSREENKVLCSVLNQVSQYEANVIRRMVATYGNIKFLEDESL